MPEGVWQYIEKERERKKKARPIHHLELLVYNVVYDFLRRRCTEWCGKVYLSGESWGLTSWSWWMNVIRRVAVGNHFVIIAQFTISGDSKLGRLILKFSVISCDAGI